MTKTTLAHRALRGGLLAAASAVLLTGCGSTATPKPAPAAQTIRDAGKSVVRLTAANDGARVVVGKAQELRVELPDDSQAVTHGLQWAVAELAPGVLAVSASTFERERRDADPFEAAGITVWRIRPIAAGHVVLKFELRRPRTVDAPAMTASYDVTVE